MHWRHQSHGQHQYLWASMQCEADQCRPPQPSQPALCRRGWVPPPVHRQRDGGRVVRKGARMQAVYTACCKPWTTSLTAGRRVATRTWSAFHDIGGVFRLPLSPAVSSDGSTATVGYFAGQRSAAWHAVWATVAFHVEWHGLVFADVRNLLRLRFVRSGTAPQSAPVALGIGSSLSFHPCSTGLLSTTLLFCYK